MRETIQLNGISPETWRKLREYVRIYELSLPEYSKVVNLTGRTKHWSSGKEARRYYWDDKEEAEILEVVKVWSNPKNTVKVILAGKGMVALFAKNGKPSGFTSLKYDRYSDTPSDVFDNVQRGTWLIIDGREGNMQKNLFFITNESKINDILKMLNTLRDIDNLKGKYSEFAWKEDHWKVPTYGTVKAFEVRQQEAIFKKVLRRFQWIKRKKRWDLWNAVKANLSMKNDGKTLKVKVKALDGMNYSLEVPVIPKEEEKEIGWRDPSVYTMDYWLPFVYRDKNEPFLKKTRTAQTEELLEIFLKILHKIPKETLIFGFNKKKITLERKTTAKGSKINYLNGKIVKGEEIKAKLKDFFLLGKPIIPSPVSSSPNLPKRRVMSKEATELIEKGLNGLMRDLEGEFPFHLNILYKEKERKWYLEIAGREFYIKGGYNSLKKVKSAIKGNAIINHSEDGYDSKSTKVVMKRIAELIGTENALWVVLQVKKMGALMKAMGAGDS